MSFLFLVQHRNKTLKKELKASTQHTQLLTEAQLLTLCYVTQHLYFYISHTIVYHIGTIEQNFTWIMCLPSLCCFFVMIFNS